MKQLKQLLLVMAIALTGFTPAQAQTPPFNHYSEWMAYARRNMVYNGSSYTSSDSGADWWRYDDGLMYESILDTYEYYKTRGGVHGSDLLSGVERYLNKSITGTVNNLTGTVEDLKITNFTGKNGEKELDDMRPGRLVYKYCYTYDHSENSKIAVYKAACKAVIDAPAFQDEYRVGYSDGHKDFPWQHKATYTQQVWLDGIFMGIPFWTLAGPHLGSSQKSSWGTNATKFFDDAVRQMQVTDSTTFVPSTGLWCHAWDYTKKLRWADCNSLSLHYPHIAAETTSGNNTGRSLHTWGRALGWYAMAIMETMDNITAVDANYAKLNDMKVLFKKVMDAVINYRDETSGVWYCVLDVGDNTAADSPYNQNNYPVDEKPEKNNYLEATCSSMFAYCLLRGVAQGYLPPSYLDDAKSAYTSVVRKFITHDSNNNLYLNSCMKVGGLDATGKGNRDGSFAYYMHEDSIQNDSKGVGPFIWASLEAEKIGYNMETNSFGPIDENTIVTFAWSKASDEITQGASYTSPTFTARSYGNDTPLTNSFEIDFESSNTAVATVAADGTVTPVGIGTATITAALKTGSTYTWSGTNPTYTITVNAPDTTAPTLEDSTPNSGATNVSTSGTIVLTFSEAVTVADASKFTLSGGTGSLTTGSITGDGTTTITIPYTGLANETSYTFATAAGAVQDASGNPNAALSNILFTTKLASAEPSTIFSFEVNADGSDIYVERQGGTQELTTSNSFSTLTGGTVTIKNKNTSSGDPDKMVGKDNSERHIRFTNTNQCVIITLNQPLEEDDIITFKSNGSAEICFTTTETRATTLSSSSGSYTIPSGSALINASTLYVWPVSTSTKIRTFTITRPGSTPPTPSTYTLTNTVNPEGYGTVSPTTVANIPSGTAVTAGTGDNINKYTVGETTVTATPATATDEYTYTFTGWSDLPETVTANATVKANFTRTAKSYTLAWNKNAEDADDLTGNYTSGTVDFGTAITAPNNPTRSGYTFNGWNSAQDGKGTALGETMPAANTTYYAQWLLEGEETSETVTPTGIDSSTKNLTFSPETNLVVNLPNGSMEYDEAKFKGDAAIDISSVGSKYIKEIVITYDATSNRHPDNANSLTIKNVTSNGSVVTSGSVLGSVTSTTSSPYTTTWTDNSNAKNINKVTLNYANTSHSLYISNIKVTYWGASETPTVEAPTFTAHPANATYTQGDTPTALSVAATGTPTPTYQWYKNTDNDRTAKAGDAIEGATAATLPVANISTETAGTFYYYCVATNSEGTATSNSATITVNAPALAINSQPVAATYTQNATASALSVTATGGSTPYSYQWYSNDTNDTTTPTAVGTNSDSYTPSTTTVGTTYYYCIVTDNASATVTSNIVAVTVNAAGGSGEPVNTTIVFKSSTKDDNGNNLAALSKGASVYVGNGIAKLIAANSVALNTSSNKYGYRCDESRLYIVFKFDGETDLSIQHNANSTGERYLRLYSFNSNKELSAITSSDWATKEQKAFTSTNTTTTWEDGQASVVTTNDGKTTWNYTTKGCLTVTWEDLHAGYYVLDGTGSEAYIYSFTANIVSSTPRTTTATIKAGKQYATFNTTMDIDFAETDGLQAFVVDNATKSSVHLTEVTVVPANTALIIKGAPNTYTLYETKKATESVSDNQLIISNSTVAADNKYYALGTVNGVQGFHRVQNGLTIPTSYVIITDQTAKSFLNFEEEENIATGIDGFATDNGFIVIDDNTPLYNLSGQRVSKSYKGIVIINGKKVLRK